MKISIFTLEEKKTIEQMLRDNRSYKEIAKKLDRGYFSIRNQVVNNGGRWEYTAELSEKNREDGDRRRDDWYRNSASESAKKNSNRGWELMKKVDEDIQSLKKSINFIYETLKEKYDSENR